MCPTRHFVYIFFNPVFQVSTAKNEINLFNNHILIVAPVTFAPAGAMTPSAEFLFQSKSIYIFSYFSMKTYVVGTQYPQQMFSWRNKKTEVLLMSTHNICFHGEIRRKKITRFPLLSRPMKMFLSEVII